MIGFASDAVCVRRGITVLSPMAISYIEKPHHKYMFSDLTKLLTHEILPQLQHKGLQMKQRE